MRQKNIGFLLLVGFALLSLPVSEAGANIVIKVRALNPLESDEVAAIRYPLPQEVTPDDIIKQSIIFSLPEEEGEGMRKKTFNVEYVQEEGQYFIIDEVMMGPREVVTLEAHIRDIWSIGEERFRGIKQRVEDLIASVTEKPAEPMEGEENPEAVAAEPDEMVLVLQEEIFSQLDEIAGRQASSTVLKVGVEGHMEAYYENVEALTQVESDIMILRNILELDEEEEEDEEGVEGEGAPMVEEGDGEEILSDGEMLEEAALVVDPADIVLEDGALEPEGDLSE